MIEVTQKEIDDLIAVCNHYSATDVWESLTFKVKSLVQNSTLPERKKSYIDGDSFEVTGFNFSLVKNSNQITIFYCDNCLKIVFTAKQ